MPKFSIIVPVYNVEKYIDECIESVIKQTYKDWELILVDDGSKDSSLEKCRSYAEKDSRIRVFSQQNGGASKARNNGLEKSCGEYILFLDSDDFYNDERALEILNGNIREDTDVLMFGCTDFNMKTGEIIVSRTGYDLDLVAQNNYFQTMHYLLSSKLIPGGPTIFTFSRNVATSNCIRFREGIQDEDYDFVLSIFTNSKSIMAIDNPFYSYRHGRAESVTGSSNIKMIYGIEYTVNKWYEIVSKISDDILKKDLLNYIAFIYTTGFIVLARMDKCSKKQAIYIMKKYKFILKYGYWKKTRLTKIGVSLFGIRLFSFLAEKYFNKTHKVL